MGASAIKLQRYRKTARPALGLRTPESFVFVHEDNHKAHDEERNHCGADEIVVAVDVEKGNVQFEGREPDVS